MQASLAAIIFEKSGRWGLLIGALESAVPRCDEDPIYIYRVRAEVGMT